MIEKIVLRYLEGKLPIPVFMSEPDNPPPKFVLLEKTASGRRNHLKRATFAIQSYGGHWRGESGDGDGSLLDAMNLNETVKAAMDGIIELPEISSSRLNSDYPFNDEERKRYRCQAVYDLTHY